MTPLTVILDIEGQWPDLAGKPHGNASAVGYLPNGTSGGKPAAFIRGTVTLPDGTTTDVILQTTFTLLSAAVRAGVARYGDPHA